MKKIDFGINVQLKHKDKKDLDKYVSLLDELNIGWVKFNFNLYDYSKNKLDLKNHDYIIKDLTNKNIKILGTLAGNIPGTLATLINLSSNEFFNPLDNFELYSKFVSHICHHYQKQIFHWQIWSEPNTERMWINKPSASEYFLLVKKIHPIIKEVNENNQIVLGAINCSPVSKSGSQKYFNNLTRYRLDNIFDNFVSSSLNEVIDNFEEYFEDLIKKRIDNFVDIYSFNPYFFGNYVCFNDSKTYQIERLKNIINTFLKIYKKNKLKKPIWITEMGISDRWVNLTSKQIGDIYIKMFNFAIKKNIKKLFIWNFIDFVDDFYSKWNVERFFGIVKSNLEPKDNFKVLKEFLNSKKTRKKRKE